ncbi:MAG: methyltransferase domain-containing protein [Thaumarchaeota archaeon]|nr:methyltransferase domain-containing protein [Nitrososphaerota archaeon]
MKRRRPGLQGRWAYVVNSLQEIIPSYEAASSRISLFADAKMRKEAVSFAVTRGGRALDLGSGPGTISRLVEASGGEPILLDVSVAMLRTSSFSNRVQGSFEHLPFKRGAFGAVVSGFALRDSRDLQEALSEVARVLGPEGRFAFCDLGKPDSLLAAMLVSFYLRVVPNIVGLVTAGRSGLRYGSLFDTYILVLRNSELRSLLLNYFGKVDVHEAQMGGSIVAKCIGA